MVGWWYKQRIKVNRLDSQFFQIIHLIQHTLQITTIKLTDTHCCRVFIPFLYLHTVIINIGIFSVENIIRLISIIESIGKNLINNRSFCPVRCMESRNNTEIIFFLYFIRAAQFIIKAMFKTVDNLKIIVKLFFIRHTADLIVVKQFCTFFKLHLSSFSVTAQVYTVCICFCSTKTDLYFLSNSRLRRNYIIFRSVTE